MKFLKIFLLIIFNKLNGSYEIVRLENINLENCIKIKEATGYRNSRVVYYDKINQSYIKIWEKDYIYSDFFLEAVKTDFFNNITPLKDIVFDEDNLCRGYTTYKISCEIDNKLKFYSFNGALKLYNAKEQNEFYNYFLEKLKIKTNETKIIYLDLVPDNLGFTCKEYYIIDLDTVVSINNIEILRKNIDLDTVLSYNPDDYQNFVNEILKKGTQ